MKQDKNGFADCAIIRIEAPETDVTPIMEEVRRKAALRAETTAFQQHAEESQNRYVHMLFSDMRRATEEFLRATAGGRGHALKSLFLRLALKLLSVRMRR